MTMMRLMEASFIIRAFESIAIKLHSGPPPAPGLVGRRTERWVVLDLGVKNLHERGELTFLVPEDVAHDHE